MAEAQGCCGIPRVMKQGAGQKEGIYSLPLVSPADLEMGKSLGSPCPDPSGGYAQGAGLSNGSSIPLYHIFLMPWGLQP